MSTENLLHNLYHDPRTGFISAQKLYKKARELDESITLKQVREWYSKQEDIQQFQTKTNKFENFKITSYNPNSWQIDLAFYGKKVILTAININSRIGFLKLLLNKKSETVLNAIEVFTRKNQAAIITSDNGSEFTNKKLEKFFEKNNIEHYNSEAGDHTTLGKIDRFIRTIKQRLMKIPSARITQKLLDEIIDNYNNTEHSAINSTPNESNGRVMHSEIAHNVELLGRVSDKLRPGDSVRYKLKSTTFGKEGAKYSDTVYTIIGIDGYKVHIQSKNNHVLYKPVNDIKVVNAPVSDAPVERNGIYEVHRILSHEKLKNGKFKYLVEWKDGDQTIENQSNLRLINKNKRSVLEQNYFAQIE